ncbi:MAG: hypothetical protein ACM3ZT_08735 [Bacillota bacterium]
MNTRFWSLVAGFILAGALVSAPAGADINWSGPGWYVEASATGLDTELVSGPYADKDTCEANKPADTDDYIYDCFYEENGGGGRAATGAREPR